MRDRLILIAILLPVLLGCGMMDRVRQAAEGNMNAPAANVNANKSLTDKAVDTAVGESKIGIPECDEAMDILSAQANNPDDNMITKAVKKTALNQFRDQLKKSLEENNANKQDVAEFCREFRNNLSDSSNQNTNSSEGTWK